MFAYSFLSDYDVRALPAADMKLQNPVTSWLKLTGSVEYESVVPNI